MGRRSDAGRNARLMEPAPAEAGNGAGEDRRRGIVRVQVGFQNCSSFLCSSDVEKC